jgi:ABC-2 type transport system permease protein
MTSLEPRTPTVTAAKSIPTYFRLLLRGQLTRGRLFGLGVLGGISFLLAIVVRTAVESRDLEEASVRLLSDYSIGLLIPLATLILGSPMIGDLVEDRLLVYLWLKPVPRWHLAVAAYAAVVATLLPVVIVPVLLTALITGFGPLIVPATVASILGVLAYSGIYLFLGARFPAGLWLGLLYLVLWENVLARFSNGMARLSLRSYLQTMLQRGTDVSIDLADRAAWASIVIPLAVAAFAVAMAAVTLATKDID